MVQFVDAMEIAREWEKKKEINPNLTCNHRGVLSKEYSRGVATEDWVCMNCGETFTREEKKKLKLQD